LKAICRAKLKGLEKGTDIHFSMMSSAAQ